MDRGWGPANTGGVYAGQGYSEEMGAAGRAVSLGNRGIYGAGGSDRPAAPAAPAPRWNTTRGGTWRRLLAFTVYECFGFAEHAS
jgi:hypothetical protein